jgi:hypothetical protein
MKLKNLWRFFSAFLILFSFGNAFSQPVKIEVFPGIKKQIIRSIGGNYCQANYSDHAWDAIGEATLKEFRSSHVRVALPVKLRNLLLNEYRGEKYTQQRIVVEVLESLKRMKNEFGVKNFTISAWDLPDEFIEDPSKKSQRVLKPEAYDEVIQMLTDFFLKAKNEYGVEVDYFSFNESDGGYQIIFSPQQTIDFIKQAGLKFKEAGLKTKFLWADTAQTKGTVEFATRIKADTAIWKFLGPLCFHSWWSESIPDNEFKRIAGLAKAWNKEVWCSELGFDAMAWKIKDMNKSWDYALRFAKISYRQMYFAEVEVSLYWTWQNNYAIMSADLKEKYPSYYVTRHQVDYLNHGTQVVHSQSSDNDILTIAALRPDGTKVLHVINMKKTGVEAIISGFEGKIADQVATTQANNWEEIKNVGKLKKGTMLVKLKPESVNTFIIK